MLRHLILATTGLLAAGAASAQDFPVTLDHVWGSTTVESEPVRIVTLGWGNEDALIALGIIPVGMPFQSYGGGDDGVQPWIAEALAAAGAATPVMLSNSGEVPFEQIAALEPDLIVAVFSGVKQEDYEVLSAMAPTIAYSGDAWSADWQEVTRTIGLAVGRTDEAEALIAETSTWLSEEVAAHPALAEITFAAGNDFDGSMGVYAALDARVKFLTGLGLTLNDSVVTLAPDDGQFYYPLSYELFDQLQGDIFVTFYENQADLDAWLATGNAQGYAPIQNGGLAALVGTENVAAVSPPSILSLRWGFPAYLDVLSQAATRVTGN